MKLQSAKLSGTCGLRVPRFSPQHKQLHWLPFTHRINFKLSTHILCSIYTTITLLGYFLHLSNKPRQLRSSISQQLIFLKTKLNLGKRSFGHTCSHELYAICSHESSVEMNNLLYPICRSFGTAISSTLFLLS